MEILRLVKNERHNKEIIIVDDGSTDGTRDLLEQISGDNIKVLFNEENHGKGYCLRRAIGHAGGDITIIQDADLEYYPDEYGSLIEKIVEGKADVVYGSRFLGSHRVFHFYHYLGNMAVNLAANILLDANLTDLMTCYKAFKTPLLKKMLLKADRFGIETEITAEIFKRKYRVYETPISYNGRTLEEGKKIKWTDFFHCIYWLLRASMRTVDVGHETLLKLTAMKNNNAWVYDKVKPFLGKNIIELGSGIGTISRYLIARGRKVTLTEINEEYARYLQSRFSANPSVKIVKADVSGIDKIFDAGSFDSAVGINLLEHIDNDAQLLKGIFKILTPGGKLILIVPAHKALFSRFDRDVGHQRRYSKKELTDKLTEAGFTVEAAEYMNFFSSAGWFINFRIFKMKQMPNFTVKLLDRFIPFIAWIEKYIRFPFGLSLFFAAQKKVISK